MTDRRPVPCNGCTTCCQNELLFLHPEDGDNPAEYLTQRVLHPLTGRPGLALKQKPNGDCMYLGISGCTIHDRAPAICREFDCRLFVASFGGRPGIRRAIKAGWVTQDIVAAARAATERTAE